MINLSRGNSPLMVEARVTFGKLIQTLSLVLFVVASVGCGKSKIEKKSDGGTFVPDATPQGGRGQGRTVAPNQPGVSSPDQAGAPAHRQSARPDQRALLRTVLLPDLHPSRLARRSHQPRKGAVGLVRTLERGDRGVRSRWKLHAACGRAHGGRRW